MVTTLVVASCVWGVLMIGTAVGMARLRRTSQRFNDHVKEAMGLVEDNNTPCSCERRHPDTEPTVHTMFGCFPEREMISND